MFKLVEGRTVAIGEKVEVYYNIQKGGFSIVSRDKSNADNGKVVAYSSDVQIKDAQFKVNTNKWEKIQEMQRKTVYAVVRGTLEGVQAVDVSSFDKGYCNPYITKGFINWETKEAVNSADAVVFYEKYFAFKGGKN